MLMLIIHAHAFTYGCVCVCIILQKCKYLAKMRVIHICIVEMGAVMYSSFCSWPIFSNLPVRPTRRLIVVTIRYQPPTRPQSENKNTNNATSVFVCLAHTCTYTHTYTFVHRPTVCLAVSGCMSFPLLWFNSLFKPYAYACMHVCVCMSVSATDFNIFSIIHWCSRSVVVVFVVLLSSIFCQFDSLLCQFINN